jgi:uncharacterized membrane protein
MGPQTVGRRRSTLAHAPHNVAQPERIASVTLGAALIAYGLRRRDSTGIVAAIIGGVFVHRGATGNCPVYSALGVSTGDSEAVLDAPRRGKRRGARLRTGE